MKILSKKRCNLGEGPIWNEKEQKLYFTNGYGANELCIYDIKNKKSTNFFAETDSLVIPDNHIFYISQPINGKVVVCTKGGTSVYDLKAKKFEIPKINNYFPLIIYAFNFLKSLFCLQ